MKKILISLMILGITFFTLLPSQNITKVNAENFCKASVVVESSSKRVLSEKNKDEKLPMASTTKIMTALVTLENAKNLDEIIKIDDRAVGIEGTSIYLRKGEEMTVRELLFGLMLPSGNDASLALAYHIGNGNFEEFVNMMNSMAQKLNLKNTHFANPHGLDQESHYTSAYDLALITIEAMKHKDFRDIVSTKNIQITGNKEVGNRFLRNKQRLLKTLEGCNGVKTGFTDNAGRCLVTSCNRNGMELISVVLNCPNMFEESARLIEEAYKTYTYETILEPYSYITSIGVEEGKYDNVKVFTMKGFKYPLKENEKELIHIETKLPEILNAPLEKEEEIGEIKIFFEKSLIFSEKIYTMESVESVDIKDKVKDIIDKWFYE